MRARIITISLLFLLSSVYFDSYYLALQNKRNYMGCQSKYVNTKKSIHGTKKKFIENALSIGNKFSKRLLNDIFNANKGMMV